MDKFQIVRCEDCRLLLTAPQPSDAELARIYGENYFLVEPDEEGHRHVELLKQQTADLYLDQLTRYGLIPAGARLLEVGSGQGDFLVRAQARGMDVTGVEYSAHANAVARRKLGEKSRLFQGEVASVPTSEGPFDVIALSDVIEHVRDPATFLSHVHALLKPGGVIFIATPTLDSWSARLLGRRWMEFKPEHLWYFNAGTLRTLLTRHGFGQTVAEACVKTLSLDYVAGHFARYQVPGLTPLIGFLRRLLPHTLRRKPLRLIASGMILLARREGSAELPAAA